MSKKRVSDVKQVILEIRKLELDFGKEFSELQNDESFWKEINNIYIPESLCQIYGAIEVTGPYSIRFQNIEGNKRVTREYEYYGHREMEDKVNLMVIYQEK